MRVKILVFPVLLLLFSVSFQQQCPPAPQIICNCTTPDGQPGVRAGASNVCLRVPCVEQ
ncbi:MAG: hypothetical protein HY650_12030 [Acidobacteria bacterium]|nr:hypothetical protein [Acidobacteriota bacterium]